MKLNLAKNLEPARTAKLAQIDADANRALESYRTSGNLTALVYKLKRDEVSAADDGRPITELAMLQAEANATGIAPEILLETWRERIRKEDEFLVIVEAKRQSLKALVRSAATLGAISAIAFD